MNTLIFILLLSLCCIARARDFDNLRRAIATSNITLFNAILKHAILSATEKQILLDYAHQKTAERKTEKDGFSSHTGFKRKAIGFILATYGIYQSIIQRSIDWNHIIAGIIIYEWGKDTEYCVSLQGFVEKNKKYDAAQAIEMLIEHELVQ